MIQRIQTIYLALATIFTILFSFLTVATITSPTSIYELSGIQLTDITKNVGVSTGANTLLTLVCGALLAMQIGAIFMYTKRPKQLIITIIAAILNLGILGLAFYCCSVVQLQFTGSTTYHLAFIFPLISAILLVMAALKIKKDEDLIKSLNRIR